ncbi:MAG TPA: MMPL family transporter [Candidatus Methylomirabilis sp.]|nr:MMPL family transporter [Candidatus Methylomirabilis sp.]
MIAISRTGRVLRRLVRLSCARPGLTLALSIALAVLGVAYTLSALTFKTSGRDVLPQNASYVKGYVAIARDFGELEDIVVVIEAGSLEGAKAFAAKLVQELRASPVKFHRIAYRIDPKQFEGRQLLYLSTDRLKEIRDKIFDHQEFMEAFAEDPTLAELVEGVDKQMATAFVSNLFDLGLDDGKPPGDSRFLGVLLDQIGTRLDRPAPYFSPWATLFSFGGDTADAGYFFSDDKSLLFILVESPKGDKGSFIGDHQAIDTVRGAIARLRASYPTVQAGVTGGPALSNDEMAAAFRDSEIATALAFALTLLVMMLAFRRVWKPILMLGVLAVSLGWSLGIVTLTIGHLTIFSVMFISIVVGIGIDYGIYFLFRYEEEIFLGRNLKEALELTAARAGPGMTIGALTAGGTFFVLLLTDFRGIQELGFIAGTAILLSWLSMMTLFPAVLVLVDRHHAARPRGRKPPAHQLERIHVPILDRLTSYPVTALTIAGVATALSIWALPSVGFDYNLLNLQATGTESVVWERRVLANTGRSGPSALATADTLDELRRKQQAIEALPSVSEVDSVLRIIPDEQQEKVAIVKSFEPLVAPVRIGKSSRVDMDRLGAALAKIKRRFDVMASEAGDKLPADLAALRDKTATVLRQLASADRETAEPALNYLQAQLYRDFVSKFYSLQRNLNPKPVSIKDVPEDLRRKFVGASGRFLMQIHPKVDIWEREGARQFVTELRSVDPSVTGSPIITYEATRLMERGYLQGTAYAFILVGSLTLLMLRRLREAALAMLPLLLGLLWTIGLMHLFGLKFNLANVWGLPLIIGASAEFGLNMILRYMEGRRHGGPLLARSTVMAVALNGITIMVGFGSLMVAAHRGIFGLGLLLTIGSACGLIASLVVVPVILRLVTREAHVTAAGLSRSPAA